MGQPNPDDESTYTAKIVSDAPSPVFLPRGEGNLFATVYITVKGASRSANTETFYSLMVGGNHKHRQLASNIPRTGLTVPGRPAYYKIRIPATESACTLMVAVTPQTGDPDLYISNSLERPTTQQGGYDKTSRNAYGFDVVQYKPAPTDKTYYVLVNSIDDASYSILATLHCAGLDTYAIVQDGQAQVGLVARDEYDYYAFYVTNGTLREVTLSVIASYGDPDLFVKTSISPVQGFPKIGNRDWEARSSGRDVLTISPTTPGYCTGCWYYMGVHAYTESLYTVTGSTDIVHVRLTDGQSRQDTLEKDQYDYYVVRWEGDAQDLQIVVTDLGIGDPDIYVDTIPFPTKQRKKWSAVSTTSDIVTIQKTDPNRCASPCDYYIAVHAYKKTTFSITATLSQPMALEDGFSQDSTAMRNQAKHFYIRMHEVTVDVSFTIRHYSGQTHLYVGTKQQPVPGQAATYSSSAMYQSGTSIITIPYNAANCENPDQCYYFLTIVGASTHTEFNVLSSRETSFIQLAQGVPVRATGQKDKFTYFFIQNDNPGYDLIFIVTPISGDPDLFVSKTERKPNKDNTPAEQSARGKGTDAVTFTDATAGVYNIGVESVDRNSEFTILAILNKISEEDVPITLADGEPQDYALTSLGHKLFRLDLRSDPVHADLTIAVNQAYGKVDLYVSGDGKIPTPAQFDRAAVDDMAKVITITGPTSSVYTFAVYGRAPSTLFTLTAKTDHGMTLLRNGISTPGLVDPEEIKVYKIPVEQENVILAVSLVTVSGPAPRFYVADTLIPATETTPARPQETWVGSGRSDDVITILPDDPKHSLECAGRQGRCVMFIGIKGMGQGSQYSLTATFNRAVQLQDGRASSGTAPNLQWSHFELRVVSNPPDMNLTSVTIAVNPDVGVPQLYVSTSQAPTLEHSMWSITDETIRGGRLVISGGDGFCAGDVRANCVYYIGVYSPAGTSTFSVVASTNFADVELRDGVAVSGSAPANGYRNYFYNFARPGEHVLFIVTPLTGDPDFYGSWVERHPTREKAQYRSLAVGADTIEIKENDSLRMENTTLYLSVHGSSNKVTSYTVITYNLNTTGATQTLVDGVPQAGVAGNHEWRYYSIATNPETMQKLVVEVNRQAGDPDLVVCEGDIRPTTTSPQEGCKTSLSSGDDRITLYNLKTQYTIGVYAYTPTLFSVTATSNAVVQRMRDGITVSVADAEKSTSYFFLEVDRIDKDLLVWVTPQNGAPELYVGPATNKHKYAAMGYSNNSVIVPRSELAFTNYYIEVGCPGGCAYTVSASFNDRAHLVDGEAQVSTINPGGVRYFFLAFRENTDATFTLTSLEGTELRLFVSSNGLDPLPNDPSTYQLTTTTTSTGQLRFKYSEKSPCYWDPCDVLRVMIQATSATDPGRFSIIGATEHAIITLQDGQIVRDWVTKDAYSYYVYRNTFAKASISVTVTPLSGTIFPPVLYLATNVSRPTKEEGNYQRVSTFTFPTVGVYTSHLDADIWKSNDNFYIGVTNAWGDSTYNIQLKLTPMDADRTPAEPILLIGGRQQTDAAEAGESHYFRYRAGSSAAVTFTIERVYGDTDLYVNFNGQKPTTTEYQDVSTAIQGNTLSYNSSACTNCWYDVMVHSNVKSFYVITAQTSNTVLDLPSGLPVTSTVQEGQVVYYSIFIESPDRDLVVSVTPQSGDPDLFVSNVVNRPNMDTCNACSGCCKHSRRIGADTVTIERPKEGFYYIGVHAYTTSTFTIVAHSTAIQLMPSIPIGGEALQGQSDIYTFTIRDDSKSNIKFILSQHNNRYPAVMYITAAKGVIPDRNNSMWSSTVPQPDIGGLRGEIVITKNDAQAVFDGIYTIAVVGPSQVASTSYNILVTTSSGVQTLVANTPTAGNVAKGKTVYYRALVSSSKFDVNLDVSVRFGAVRTYMSTTHGKPDNSTAQWRTNHVSISHTNPDFYVGVYYIAIEGVGTEPQSSFTLTFGTSNTVLFMGEAQNAVARETGNFFVVKLEESNTDLKVNVAPLSALELEYTPTSFARPRVYNADGSLANNDDVVEAAEAGVTILEEVNMRDVSVLSTDPSTEEGALYQQFMQARARRNDYTARAAAAAGHATTVTADGVMLSYSNEAAGAVNSAAAARGDAGITTEVVTNDVLGLETPASTSTSVSYSVAEKVHTPAALAKAIESRVKSLADAALQDDPHTTVKFTVYVTTDGANPTPSTDAQAMWKGILTPPNYTFLISRGSKHFCADCNYYIGVFTTKDQAYALTTTTTNTVESLTDGVLRESTVRVEEYSYFALNAAHTDNITVVLEPCYGSTHLFVSQDSYTPVDGDSNYASKNDHVANIIPIKGSGQSQSSPLRAYTVGVLGKESADTSPTVAFTLYASTQPYKRPIPRSLDLSVSTPNIGAIRVKVDACTRQNADAPVQYRLYVVPENEPGTASTKCGLERLRNEPTGVYEESAFTNKVMYVDVKGLEKGATYRVNVVAVDTDGKYVVYRPATITTLDVAPAGDSNTGTIVAIVVPIGVILLIVIFCLYLRNRRLTKELEIEIHDVPKSAVRKAVRGPTSDQADSAGPAKKPTEKYSQLLTEDEEVPVASDYAPPRDSIGQVNL